MLTTLAEEEAFLRPEVLLSLLQDDDAPGSRRDPRRQTLRLLFAFLSQGEVAAFHRECGASADRHRELVARWLKAQSCIESLPPYPSDSDAMLMSTSATNIGEGAALGGESTIYNFQIDQLISAQKFVDIDYIRSLSIPSPADRMAVLSFCVDADRELSMPIIEGDGAMTFASCDVPNFTIDVPRAHRKSERRIEVTFAITARANSTHVIAWNDRYVLANGTHRAVALYASGHLTIPCSVTRVADIGALGGLKAPGMFTPDIIGRRRPPLVVDYVSSELFTDLWRYRRSHGLRISLQAQRFEMPELMHPQEVERKR